MSEPQHAPPDLTIVGQDHIAAYQDSRGRVGYLWNGVPTLLLTAIGRRSGHARTSALIFGRDGEDYLVVASKGGSPNHPAWYLNLQATPQATIQVKAEHISVLARTASEVEKPRLWTIMTGIWPNYDVYQTRTHRDIPVVMLTPT